jgi:hypothetical protein
MYHAGLIFGGKVWCSTLSGSVITPLTPQILDKPETLLQHQWRRLIWLAPSWSRQWGPRFSDPFCRVWTDQSRVWLWRKKWSRRPELNSAGVRLFDCPADRLFGRFSIIRLPRNFFKRFFFLSLSSVMMIGFICYSCSKSIITFSFFVDVIKHFSS